MGSEILEVLKVDGNEYICLVKGTVQDEYRSMMKEFDLELMALAIRLDVPGAHGPRLLPVPEEVFTEIDAIKLLTCAEVELVASGGVCGAEGSVWLAVSGSDEQVDTAVRLLKDISLEPGFEI